MRISVEDLEGAWGQLEEALSGVAYALEQVDAEEVAVRARLSDAKVMVDSVMKWIEGRLDNQQRLALSDLEGVAP